MNLGPLRKRTSFNIGKLKVYNEHAERDKLTTQVMRKHIHFSGRNVGWNKVRKVCSYLFLYLCFLEQ